MKQLALVALLLFGAGHGLPAEAQSVPSPRPGTRGVPIRLFDGQTTTGWAKRDGSPHEGWVVDDGALFRRSGGGDLYYQYPLRDFELYFQWRISEGGNSGVKYRVRAYGDRWLGCEYQVLDDDKHRDANKSASLYDVLDPPAWKPRVRPGVWHQARIRVCGNRIEHWLDGVLTVQTSTDSPQWRAAVADSKFADVPEFGENREGLLFLQDHGNPVWYRELILVPLDCDLAPPSAPVMCAAPCPAPACSGFSRFRRCRPRARRCIDWRGRGRR